MRLIYISIPMNGRNEEKQKEKINKIREKFRDDACISPYELRDKLNRIYEEKGEIPSYSDYLLYDLRVLVFCDTIYMCAGWDKSKGCRVEHEMAKSIDMKIIYESEL